MPYPIPLQNLPIAPGTIYKFTFFFNGPNCGWSETFYIKPAVQNPSTVLLDAIAVSYWNNRGLWATQDYTAQGYRYGDVAISGNSELRVPDVWPQVGKYTGSPRPGTGDPEANNIGVQIRLSDQQQLIRRNEIFRGIPVAFNGNTASSANAVNRTGNFNNALIKMQQWFKTIPLGITLPDGTQNGGQAALKYFVKDPAVNPAADVVTVNQGTNSWLLLGVVDNGTSPFLRNLLVGQQIVIGGIRLKCAKKLNGRTRIVSITAPTANQPLWQIQTCKPFCCLGAPILCSTSGTLRLPIFNYSGIVQVAPQVIASRKTGRPFRLRPGRRPTCCV